MSPDKRVLIDVKDGFNDLRNEAITWKGNLDEVNRKRLDHDAESYSRILNNKCSLLLRHFQNNPDETRHLTREYAGLFRYGSPCDMMTKDFKKAVEKIAGCEELISLQVKGEFDW